MRRVRVTGALGLGLILAAGWWASVAAQGSPAPEAECPQLLSCRSAEINLAPAWGLPFSLQGHLRCAQFCGADYWIRRADTGVVLLEYGQGGPMGPALLAWRIQSEAAGLR